MDRNDLRELRKKEGITAKNLAKEIGVHEKTLFRMEREFRNNHFIKLLKCYRSKNVDINKFLDNI